VKEFILRILFKVGALLLVIVIGMIIKEKITDIKFEKEQDARFERMNIRGPSPITRGGHRIDTTKIDTIK
jgi:hypothetical protein